MIFRTDIVAVDVLEVVPSADGFRLFETEAEAVWNGIVNEQYDGCGECPELCKPPTSRPDNGPVVVWDA